MRVQLFLISLVLLTISCSGNDCGCVTPPEETMYFPPITSETSWETKSVESMDWNTANLQTLYTYLEQKNTKGFIILHNGRIVVEKYFNGHSAGMPWYWASAGKTLTASITGIAEHEGYINTNNKVSDYLGTGWTSAPIAKEQLITCKHLLTMTSGLDDSFNDSTDPTLDDCVNPGCLIYTADAGTRWAYDNVYVKLQQIVANATGQNWDTYFTAKLKSKIGMSGSWIQSDNNSIYWSTTRSMARFGLLALTKGKWDGTVVVPENYMNLATSTSQNINQAYGYLWWLNGKNSYHLPSSQLQFPGSLIPNAPSDLFCALGKNDQKIYVVPSRKLVIIRMGNAADTSNFALSNFDNELWSKINAVIN
jgi:CubicO group peptidase (beta-lactamase class C family)